MKKTKRQSKVIFAVVLVAVFLALGISYYINDIQKALWNQAVSGILEVTSQGSHAFEVYIEKDVEAACKV